jgi:hypothetical protein
MTIDEVLERIRKAYAAKLSAIKGDADGVRNAVNTYESAAQDDALNKFLMVNGIISTKVEKKAENAALDLLSVVENLPELRPADTIELPEVPEEEEPEEEAGTEETPVEATLPFPLLHKDGRPILVFGGFVVEEKLRAIKKRSGLNVEWVSNERASSGDSECESAARRIRHGAYCGLIMLNELMSHRQSENLIRAAKSAGVQHAVGKKGGTAALLTALSLFEKQRQEEGVK